MNNFSNLVPGGGLTAHEAAGGHTLAKHVGKTEAELASRLATNPRLLIASSFRDRSTAEQAISEAINANQPLILSWLSSSKTKLQLLPYIATFPVGVSQIRGSSGLIFVYQVEVILRRDSTLPLGYYILTAYPQP
ncbi:hypothetical protein NG798_11830 [Ancylothrix sp. C2]|uniref:RNase A-like domain-containing protein n=1 Tax=Ancylothrix sp. D3o TaxID=2953691 RepID=UPI0021BB4E3F|nr:RNase A-like domain-containing protein [Ancylothrix sp. D3o]MCT7950481.1 hypothetical protein [Ancylothrix sp. D3o]